MKISLTSVLVDDPIKAFRFYTEVLGFAERIFMPEAQLAIVVSPEEPNAKDYFSSQTAISAPGHFRKLSSMRDYR